MNNTIFTPVNEQVASRVGITTNEVEEKKTALYTQLFRVAIL